MTALEDLQQVEEGHRRTLTAQPNDLQYEIDRFEYVKKRMVPKFIDITFRQADGWRKYVSDPEPIFKIEAQRLTGPAWVVSRSYKDFEELRQYMLEQHPDCIVPFLPPMPKEKDPDLKHKWQKLGNHLAQFLEKCFLAPSLKYDKLLCFFITKTQSIASFADSFKKD